MTFSLKRIAEIGRQHVSQVKTTIKNEKASKEQKTTLLLFSDKKKKKKPESLK